MRFQLKKIQILAFGFICKPKQACHYFLIYLLSAWGRNKLWLKYQPSVDTILVLGKTLCYYLIINITQSWEHNTKTH